MRMEAADLPCQLQTVHIRHVDIQKSQVYGMVFQPGQRLLRRGKRLHIGQEPVRPAAGDDLRQHQGIIVHTDGSHTLPSVSCATRMSVIAHWSPVSAA